MSRNIEKELEKFEENFQKLKHVFNVEKVSPFAYTLRPQKDKVIPHAPKTLALTVSGLIHGNESVGVAVLNEFLTLLESQMLDFRIPIGIFLGNVPAALKNTRFLQRDLNRSFNKDGDSLEEKRAQELSPLLQDTMWYLDLHQTNRPVEEPFFIFPFTKETVLFAQNLSPFTTVVTHIHSGFSKDGMSTDEYVQKHGGVGLTLESGQAGFDRMQIGFALKTLLHTIRYVQSTLEKGSSPEDLHHQVENRKYFLLKETIPCPQEGEIRLAKDLNNLQAVKKGDFLAKVDSKEILSPKDGHIIFPNYSVETKKPGERPAEIMRIMEEIPYSKLPL